MDVKIWPLPLGPLATCGGVAMSWIRHFDMVSLVCAVWRCAGDGELSFTLSLVPAEDSLLLAPTSTLGFCFAYCQEHLVVLPMCQVLIGILA